MTRVVAVCAALFLVSPVNAQVRVAVQGGASAMSTLVHDSIVERVSVRPGIAPNLGFSVETELNTAWRLSATLGMAWSRLARHTGGESASVVPLTLWTPTLALTRHLGSAVNLRLSIGAVAYHPEHKNGNLFSAGSPILPLVGAGVGIEREMMNSLRYALELGYDLHRFTTTALQTSGFSGAQAVHRVSLSISLSRVIRD